MNIAIIAIVGLGALFALANKASAKASGSTPPESTAPQLPPPEPEQAAADNSLHYEQPAYATPAPSAPQASNRPFAGQPLEVDLPDQDEARAAAAEERAQAAAAQPSAAQQQQQPGTSLSFKKATPATPPTLKLAAAAAATKPAATPAAKRTPIKAATELLEYVTAVIKSGQAATLGSKPSPNPLVKAAQLDMGVTPADGIYGPATRNKGKAITGKAFPARDAPPQSVAVTAAKPKAAAAPPKLTAVATVAKTPPTTRSAAQAARELLAYATAAIARRATLGSKGAPDPFVKAAQLDMGISPADGIYGPATRTKGKALTGSTFPAR